MNMEFTDPALQAMFAAGKIKIILKEEFLMRALSILFTLLFLAGSLSAKIWTVDNRPGANFTTLSAAHTAAVAGDTILVAGSSASYAGFTCTKQLTIIGPGYFLDENSGLQANEFPATIGTCYFNSGSANSVLIGLYFYGQIYFNVKATMSRCNSTTTYANLNLNTGSSGSVISQCYIVSTGTNYSSSSIEIGNNLSDLIISNCYIEHAGNYYATISTNSYSLSGNSAVYNNVIVGPAKISGGSFYSNIMTNGTFTSSGVTPLNNIGNSTQFPSGNGNKQNVNMDDVFTGTGSTDGRWQIKAGGPADNAGFSGADCGMFDNSLNMGYILSGIPPIPAIYEFTANADLSSITVKARTNQ